MAPNGSDTAAGGLTVNMAWRTFAFVLPRLMPGDTLSLADGTYTPAVSGHFVVNCGVSGTSGTVNAPIVIRAVNERRGGGRRERDGSPSRPSSSTRAPYWVVDGLDSDDGGQRDQHG